VLNLSDEQFIIGQDMSPDLFPDEEAWKFGAQMAVHMTSRPTDVVYLTPDRPRASTLNSVTSESEADDNEVSEKDERAKAVVSNSDDDSDEHTLAVVPLTASE